ncbi:LysE family translocator [Acinetobacter sp. SAAs474]|uniref:LysE family translocator n=2 Tax=unclassified Acinetobacter TaxID=196816 RepID=UPI0029348312|nr:LysE family translocator [Acinetobacter sp. SAAs474]WOE39037.1 LysE family translocator [Acinetobacter sp. SAAs474]
MSYLLTLTIAAIIPGPGMTGLMFKTLLQGYRNSFIMLLGLITGDIIFLIISILFVSSLNQILPNFSAYLIILSSAYLLYLAYKFWSFKGNLLSISSHPPIQEVLYSYRDGLLITLSNPKTISFYIALVPAIFGPSAVQQQILLIIVLTGLILILIGCIYIFFAWHLQKLLAHHTVQRLLRQCLAALLVILALSMLYQQFSSHKAILMIF